MKHRHWYKGDVPLNVHQKCNPRCPFLRSLGGKSKSSVEQRPTRSYIQPESLGNNVEGEEISKHSLQFPDYNDEAIRLQSFKHWGGVLPAQELAEGGFYMIARRDVVRCFSCKVVVQDWERSDNVIDEHHRLSPHCAFVRSFTSSVGVSTMEKERSLTMNSSNSCHEIKPVLQANTQMNCLGIHNQSHPAEKTFERFVYTIEVFKSVSDTDSIASEELIVSCAG